MKNSGLLLLCGAICGCSPVPELVGTIQAPIDGGDQDASAVGKPPVRPGRDLGSGGADMRPRGDLGGADDLGMPDPGPCPPALGVTAAFCYWPQGPGNLNLSAALLLSVADTNCDLTMGRLSVNAAGTTCMAEFTPAALASWGFAPGKPAHLAFSYSIHGTFDHSILAVNVPAGSMNEVIKVNGIAGNQNVLNLYSPMGTMFAPGFSLSLGGSAKKGSLTLDWVSVWQ